MKYLAKGISLDIDPLLERVLNDLGISDGASKIYAYLLKKGPSTAGNITNVMGENKALVYRRLKFLLSKGYIRSTISYPANFQATPIDLIVDQFTECRKRELENIIENKKKLEKS